MATAAISVQNIFQFTVRNLQTILPGHERPSKNTRFYNMDFPMVL
jgi:hypothetical protein